MGRALLESLENRQFFSAGPAAGQQLPPMFGPGGPGGPGGGQHQPPTGAPSTGGTATGGTSTTTQPTMAKPVAVYQGKITLSDSSTRPFCLAILTEGTDGSVTANIPGPGGPVSLTGTKAGSTYTLSGTKGSDSFAVTATVDASGNVTGTVTRTTTATDGTTTTETGTLALTKADATQPPKGGQGGDDHGGPGGPGGQQGTPVTLLADYDGTLTLADGTTHKFALGIISEGADGTVTACLPGPGGGIKLTGTKSGSTYTLSGKRDNVSVSITATVDASGNVTGTFTKTTTASDSTTTTETGTLALTLDTTHGKPTSTTTTAPTTTTTATTKSSAKSATTSTLSRSVSSTSSTTPSFTNLVTYTGKMTIGDRTADVIIQTYTNKNGKTLVAIRSRRLLGRRSLVLEATITGTSITASRTDGNHSVSVSLAIATDGSLTGGVTFKKGTIERSATIDADKVTTNA